MSTKATVLIFTKIPGLAPCKTRLAQSLALGEQDTTALAAALLADTLCAVSQLEQTAVCLACEPAVDAAAIAQSISATQPVQQLLESCRIIPQHGKTFSERLENAVADISSGSPLLILGSDCPLLSPEILNSAATAVAAGNIALGPAPAGGLYCIGLPSTLLTEQVCFGDLFTNETKTELESFVELGNKGNIAVRLLPYLPDIDTADDLTDALPLIRAQQSAEKNYCPGQRTLAAVTSLQLQFSRSSSDNRIVDVF